MLNNSGSGCQERDEKMISIVVRRNAQFGDSECSLFRNVWGFMDAVVRICLWNVWFGCEIGYSRNSSIDLDICDGEDENSAIGVTFEFSTNIWVCFYVKYALNL